MKAGTILIAIAQGFMEEDEISLTIGKEYKVKRCDENDWWFTIIDDNEIEQQFERKFYNDFFKLK